MEQKLIDAQLWTAEDGHLNNLSCSDAWRVLARLGAPYRYAGKAQDGRSEYLVLDPKTGNVIATGRGESTSEAMCEAALAAKRAMQA
ncbi:MAG: hypothetical protein C0622_14170 [Desulfuromonas sp.]|nr:MAG: hypothetical protein C0622_14170 [Desulfuromonas sp.]